MPNYSKCLLIGNVVKELTLRYTPSGKPVLDLALAINDGYGDKKKTSFVDITAWDKKAELLAGTVQKGDPLFVEGRLEQESWEDQQGNRRSKLKVVLWDFQYLKPRDQAAAPQGQAAAPPPQQPQPGQHATYGNGPIDPASATF